MTGYADLPNLSVTGKDGVVFAYRDTQGTATPSFFSSTSGGTWTTGTLR